LDPEPSIISAYTLDTTLTFGFVGIFALLFCSAIVSGAEIAFFSLSQKDIDETIQENTSKGKIIASLLEKPKKTISHTSCR
jgi:CBS domain containing-hemolysin-like protein